MWFLYRADVESLFYITNGISNMRNIIISSLCSWSDWFQKAEFAIWSQGPKVLLKIVKLGRFLLLHFCTQLKLQSNRMKKMLMLIDACSKSLREGG